MTTATIRAGRPAVLDHLEAVVLAARQSSTEARLGMAIAAFGWTAIVLLARPGLPWSTAQEALCYFLPSLSAPYVLSDWTSPVAYVYSPAFLQLLSPLTGLPWQIFVGVWAAILFGAVRFLAGPRLFWLAVIAAGPELIGGNIALLITVAIVLGFRWPAMWSFVLLTKITPGIGLLWFAARREWRNLGIALGATMAVVTVSAVAAPSAWIDWLQVLERSVGHSPTSAAVPIPFVVRLPIAVAIVVWGARTDRRWAVPVAAMVALPALWFGGFSMLLGVVALRMQDTDRPPRITGGRTAGAAAARESGRAPSFGRTQEPVLG